MSDISLHFSPWVSVAMFGVLYWYALAPAGLLMAAIGWFGRTLPIVVRYAAWIGAGLCATPFMLLFIVFVGDGLKKANQAAEDRALHRTLAAAETVREMPLPAGAVLAFSDTAQRNLRSVALPRPAPVAGILLKGTLEPITPREWLGELARDQVIGGVPCRAGDLWFTPKGAVTGCTLSEVHPLAGYNLPGGAVISHDPVTGGWEFQLPQDGPALRIPALGADLPAGGTLVLTTGGAVRRLYATHETQMVIAGVALNDHIILSGTTLTGQLAKPTLVSGAMLPADAVVRLDLATGRVEATTRSLVIDP